MVTLVFNISEVDSVVNLDMSKEECGRYIETFCKRAGLVKTADDTYSTVKGTPEYENALSLVLHLWENKPLMNSLKDWMWIDDNEDVDEEERIRELKADLEETDKKLEAACGR